MDKKFDSMIFYESYKQSIECLRCSKEEKADYYDAILNYAFYGTEPNFENQNLKALFMICKANIQANVNKKRMHERDVENGKKGGAPKRNQNARKTTPKTTPKTTINDKVNDYEKDNVNVTDNDLSFLKQEKRGKSGESLKERNLAFFNSLQPYMETYGKECLQDFYDYWIEPDLKKEKLRFEMEKTWNLEYRLKQWGKKRMSMNLDKNDETSCYEK